MRGEWDAWPTNPRILGRINKNNDTALLPHPSPMRLPSYSSKNHTSEWICQAAGSPIQRCDRHFHQFNQISKFSSIEKLSSRGELVIEQKFGASKLLLWWPDHTIWNKLNFIYHVPPASSTALILFPVCPKKTPGLMSFLQSDGKDSSWSLRNFQGCWFWSFWSDWWFGPVFKTIPPCCRLRGFPRRLSCSLSKNCHFW